MRRLPENQVMVRKIDDDHVAVSAYEHQGYRHWTKFALADLPNDLVRLEDLERAGIHSGHKATVEKL